MDTAAYLRDIREQYISFYRSVLKEKRQRGIQCSTEVWVEPNVPPGERKPPHPLCIDILESQGDKQEMAMVGANESIEGALIGTMQVGTVPVKVYAAVWDALPVWLQHPDPDWTVLEPWKTKWMDVHRSGQADADGLANVVHYLGEPMAEGGGFVYVIDLGSASVDALMELLEALAAMGTTEIELGRSDGSDLPADVQQILRQPDLTLEHLTTALTRAIKDVPGIQQVEQTGEGEISVNNGSLRIYTGNLYQVLLRVGVEARTKEVYRFIRGHRESMGPKSAPDLSQLRLVVKDGRFFEQMRHLCPGAKPVVTQKLAGDLWLTCVWDEPNGMRFVNDDEPHIYGLNNELTFERARENYLKNRPQVELARDGCLWVAQTRDCYDATLLVDDQWWAAQQASVDGELLACAPARHVVLFGDSANPHTLAQLRRAAKKVAAGGDHLISGAILVRRNTEWQPFEEEPAAELADPSPTSGPRRKPWWKFW
jgi:hypothetical protein